MRNIVYVPDFLANRMALVNCANENFGNLPVDPLIERHFSRSWEYSIYNTTKKILQLTKENPKLTTNKAANKFADELSRHVHPMWPNRTKDIIASLKPNWHRS